MSLSALLVHEVTIVRPGVIDDNGDTVKDWTDDAATSTVVQGRVAQAQPTEVLANREAQVTTWKLFLLPDADLEPTDRVEWNGSTFEVDGDPYPVTGRSTDVHHIEARLRRVAG